MPRKPFDPINGCKTPQCKGEKISNICPFCHRCWFAIHQAKRHQVYQLTSSFYNGNALIEEKMKDFIEGVGNDILAFEIKEGRLAQKGDGI